MKKMRVDKAVAASSLLTLALVTVAPNVTLAEQVEGDGAQACMAEGEPEAAPQEEPSSTQDCSEEQSEAPATPAEDPVEHEAPAPEQDCQSEPTPAAQEPERGAEAHESASDAVPSSPAPRTTSSPSNAATSGSGAGVPRSDAPRSDARGGEQASAGATASHASSSAASAPARQSAAAPASAPVRDSRTTAWPQMPYAPLGMPAYAAWGGYAPLPGYAPRMPYIPQYVPVQAMPAGYPMPGYLPQAMPVRTAAVGYPMPGYLPQALPVRAAPVGYPMPGYTPQALPVRTTPVGYPMPGYTPQAMAAGLPAAGFAPQAMPIRAANPTQALSMAYARQTPQAFPIPTQAGSPWDARGLAASPLQTASALVGGQDLGQAALAASQPLLGGMALMGSSPLATPNVGSALMSRLLMPAGAGLPGLGWTGLVTGQGLPSLPQFASASGVLRGFSAPMLAGAGLAAQPLLTPQARLVPIQQVTILRPFLRAMRLVPVIRAIPLPRLVRIRPIIPIVPIIPQPDYVPGRESEIDIDGQSVPPITPERKEVTPAPEPEPIPAPLPVQPQPLKPREATILPTVKPTKTIAPAIPAPQPASPATPMLRQTLPKTDDTARPLQTALLGIAALATTLSGLVLRRRS